MQVVLTLPTLIWFHLLHHHDQWDPSATGLSIPESGIGTLPLHTAASLGRTECFSALLNYDASAAAVTTAGPHLRPPTPPPRSAWPKFSCRLRGLPAVYRFPFWWVSAPYPIGLWGECIQSITFSALSHMLSWLYCGRFCVSNCSCLMDSTTSLGDIL